MYIMPAKYMLYVHQAQTNGYNINSLGTVRDILGLHPYDIVEVNPSQHPDHLVGLWSVFPYSN